MTGIDGKSWNGVLMLVASNVVQPQALNESSLRYFCDCSSASSFFAVEPAAVASKVRDNWTTNFMTTHNSLPPPLTTVQWCILLEQGMGKMKNKVQEVVSLPRRGTVHRKTYFV